MSAIILDLDNCISDDQWRIPFIRKNEPNLDYKFNDYHSVAAFDQCKNQQLFLNCEHSIYIFTARPEFWRLPTMAWLQFAGCDATGIFMRPNDCHDNSVLIKKVFLDALLEELDEAGEEIFAAYDDREDVIEMYKENGINGIRIAIHGDETP